MVIGKKTALCEAHVTGLSQSDDNDLMPKHCSVGDRQAKFL